MIDWLTARVWAAYTVPAGKIISIDSDGQIEWQAPRRLEVRGSHDSTVTVRNFGYDGSIEISGNPAKFLQGHNVFGSGDVALVVVFLRRVFATLGYQLTPEEDALLERGIVRLTRVDVTESWDFGTTPRALTVIRSLADLSTFNYRGRGSSTSEGTVYWRKHSRRLASKAYAKGHELKAHPFPRTLSQADQLHDYAAGLVRFEFTLRSLWLKREGLDMLHGWGKVGATPEGLHAKLMADLNISDASIIEAKTLEGLPPRLQLAYDAWLAGKDLRAILPRNTFYRYRSALLPHGVDLSTLRPGTPESNVTPLRVVLVGRPVSVPDWAKGTPLYFEPRAA